MSSLISSLWENLHCSSFPCTLMHTHMQIKNILDKIMTQLKSVTKTKGVKSISIFIRIGKILCIPRPNSLEPSQALTFYMESQQINLSLNFNFLTFCTFAPFSFLRHLPFSASWSKEVETDPKWLTGLYYHYLIGQLMVWYFST